jgi:polysaccharide biosynthesis protein PslG
MKSRVLLMAWSAALLVANAPLVSATELPELVVPAGLGVNIHFTDPRPGEMEMIAQGGFRWVRMDLGWGTSEREKGKYDFSAHERLLASLEKHHIRAILILDYANRHYDQGLSPASDEGRKAFARWAAAAARHFRGRGVLWEMYNEPNITFWKPKPDVKQYVKLALEVGKALREAEPGEQYIGPATSEIDFPFLEACFRAGLLEYWSAVSVHPYRPQNPETVAGEYARLRQLISRYAPKGKKVPILSGEWGYSSAWTDVDETHQGKMLARQWLTNLACEVPLSIWYDWHDDGQDPKDPEHHLGTVHYPYDPARHPVYEPKPAYLAAQALTMALDGFAFQKRIVLESAEDYALVLTKGDESRLAVWTTAASPHAVRIPVSPGRFHVVGYTGQSLPPLTADSHGLRMTVLDAPQYLVPEPPKSER